MDVPPLVYHSLRMHERDSLNTRLLVLYARNYQREASYFKTQVLDRALPKLENSRKTMVGITPYRRRAFSAPGTVCNMAASVPDSPTAWRDGSVPEMVTRVPMAKPFLAAEFDLKAFAKIVESLSMLTSLIRFSYVEELSKDGFLKDKTYERDSSAAFSYSSLLPYHPRYVVSGETSGVSFGSPLRNGGTVTSSQSSDDFNPPPFNRCLKLAAERFYATVLSVLQEDDSYIAAPESELALLAGRRYLSDAATGQRLWSIFNAPLLLAEFTDDSVTRFVTMPLMLDALYNVLVKVLRGDLLVTDPTIMTGAVFQSEVKFLTFCNLMFGLYEDLSTYVARVLTECRTFKKQSQLLEKIRKKREGSLRDDSRIAAMYS